MNDPASSSLTLQGLVLYASYPIARLPGVGPVPGLGASLEKLGLSGSIPDPFPLAYRAMTLAVDACSASGVEGEHGVRVGYQETSSQYSLSGTKHGRVWPSATGWLVRLAEKPTLLTYRGVPCSAADTHARIKPRAPAHHGREAGSGSVHRRRPAKHAAVARVGRARLAWYVRYGHADILTADTGILRSAGL